MSKFEWHAAADGVPEAGDGRWLLLGNRGGLYVATKCIYGFRGPLNAVFYVPNRRDNYMDVDAVKAWAEIPPYEEVDG